MCISYSHLLHQLLFLCFFMSGFLKREQRMVGCDEEQELHAPTINHGVGEGDEEEEEEAEEEEGNSSNNDNALHKEPEVSAPLHVSGPSLKTRLRWSPQLHATFVGAVNLLGGPHRATPKAIMRKMDVKGITLFHVKSHLQKYRLGVKELREGTSQKTEATAAQVWKERHGESSLTLSLLRPHENEIYELNEDLKAKKEVQEKVCLQNEVEKHLQLRQVAERRYMSLALENACEKLAHQFLGGFASEFAGVFGNNDAGLGTTGPMPYNITEAMQLSFAHQLGWFQPPNEAYFANGDHLVSDGHSGNSVVEDFHIGSEMIQPKTEPYFATEDNLISDGHSGNSSVVDFHAFSQNVKEEVESLEDDPAEAYLVLDTTENASGNL